LELQESALFNEKFEKPSTNQSKGSEENQNNNLLDEKPRNQSRRSTTSQNQYKKGSIYISNRRKKLPKIESPREVNPSNLNSLSPTNSPREEYKTSNTGFGVHKR
jgi:hypothetical protein